MAGENVYTNDQAEEVHITHINNTRSILQSEMDNCQIGIETDTKHLSFIDDAGIYRTISIDDNLAHSISDHIDINTAANGIIFYDGSTFTTKALLESDIPTLQQSKISGLVTTLQGKQDNITGTTNRVIKKISTGVSTGSIIDDGSKIVSLLNTAVGSDITPRNKLHIHENSGGEVYLQITNNATGLADNNDGMTLGINSLGDTAIRTGYGSAIVLQHESPFNPGTFTNIAALNHYSIVLNKDTYITGNLIVNSTNIIDSINNHTHTSLLVPDTRNVATTTSDYNRALKVNFKSSSAIGLPVGTYSTVLGVFGWTESSGGTAHELAFGSNGIYSRRGIPGNDWGSFSRILTTADNPSAIGAAPAVHAHAIADVTSLQTALDGKLDNLGVSITSFADIGPNTSSAITIFSSGFNKPDQPSGASYWSGAEFRHNIVEDYRSQIAMGTTGAIPKIAFRNKSAGASWGSWVYAWHTANFDPSTKSDTDHTHTPSAIGAEPAITGTAYKVLSIQSDGSGVKTGCLRDLGNYAAIDNAERFAIIHSTDQAAISLQSQGGNRLWISSAPSVLNIGGAGTTAPENGQLQIYYNSRVVIPSLPLLVGKATATTGNPYKLEVEGNTLVNGNSFLEGYLTFAGANKRIVSNTATTDKNSAISIGYPNAANSGYVVVHEINHATRPGDVVLQAGGSNGAIYMSPRAYFGTRPANDHRWTLALDQYNTLYGAVNGTNIMHNLYYDGANWRYRYGSGSNSGGVITTLAYNQFSVQVANNGTTGTVATLNPAIFSNLLGNTAFGKNTFAGGYRLEVEGNTLVNGTLKANDFGDGWADYSSSLEVAGFSETGLTKRIYFKKEGKRITIVFYFSGTCNGYFHLNHRPVGDVKSEHMLADKSLYTGILHYDGYINGFASTIIGTVGPAIRIIAITSDGNRFPRDSNGKQLTVRGSFTYYTD